MSSGTHLVMYGLDPMLLITRSRVLLTAGVDVEVASNMEQFEELLRAKPGLHGIVLCHTTPEAARVELHRQAGELGLPIYQITGMLMPNNLIQEIRRAI